MLQVRFEGATLHSSERTVRMTCRFNPGVRATWISCCSTSRPPLPNACYLAYIIICHLRLEYLLFKHDLLFQAWIMTYYPHYIEALQY